ncbi:MAG: Crp/Fnr family transcriptional regulator, partial [Akkermansiaceae bacterium]
DDLYIITEGQVNIEKRSDGSRRKVLAILDRGDFFGEMAVITHGKRCAAAVASQPLILLSVGKASFLSLLQKEGPLCFEILQQVRERLEAADSEIESLTFQNLPGRIAGKILDLGKRFGRLNASGQTEIDLDVTHAGLAEMVGTNRETVSKYISIFRKEGSIEHESKKLTIKDANLLSTWS